MANEREFDKQRELPPAPTPTPKTDAIEKIPSIEDRYRPLLDLARQLEREISEAKREARAAFGQLYQDHDASALSHVATPAQGETPRTDEAEMHYSMDGEEIHFVDSNIARKLERELADARKEIAKSEQKQLKAMEFGAQSVRSSIEPPQDWKDIFEQYRRYAHTDAWLYQQIEAHARRAQPSATLTPQWVSVKDRLPADGDRVLVLWRAQDGEQPMDVEMGTAVKALAQTPNDVADDAYVTHWMPLPSAPTDGGAA